MISMEQLGELEPGMIFRSPYSEIHYTLYWRDQYSDVFTATYKVISAYLDDIDTWFVEEHTLEDFQIEIYEKEDTLPQHSVPEWLNLPEIKYPTLDTE